MRLVSDRLVYCQVDPAVSASFYFIKSLLHKQEQNFAEFYKSSLLYLAFISSDALPKDSKLVRPADPRNSTLDSVSPHQEPGAFIH